MKKNLSKVHVPHCKNTAAMAAVAIMPPKEVLIPTAQASGAPAIPVVAVNDHVYVGTLIATADEKISCPVHSSVSGTVIAIEDYTEGKKCKAIRIESDGKMEHDPNLKPAEITDLDSFLQAVKDSGDCGLGGAAFPTWAKLDAVRKNDVETMLINGAECEPFLTSDTRTMIEMPNYMKSGVELLKKWCNIRKFIIGIEANKPECIKMMEETFKDDPDTTIKVLDSVYPQGAKQMLLYNGVGKVVPEVARLASVGVLIINVTSLAYMAKYIETGMPLVERIITVDGTPVASPKNVIAPIGTPISYVIEQAGGYKSEVGKVIIGGPMMGNAVKSLDTVVMKATNGIVSFTPEEAMEIEPTDCIHCGRCVDNCPLSLNPVAYAKAMDCDDEEERLAILTDEQVGICMECGCCGYVCPAHRPLVQTNRAAKAFVRSKKPR